MSDGITAASDWFSGTGEAGATFGDFGSSLGGFDAPTSLFADGAGGLASAADLTSPTGDWLGAFGDIGNAAADIGATDWTGFAGDFGTGSTPQAFGGATDFGALDQAGGGTFTGTGGAAALDPLSGGDMVESPGMWSAQDPGTEFVTGGGMNFGQAATGGQSAASSLPTFAGGGGPPNAGPWINPDTGMPGVEPPGALERAGSWAGDFAKANPGLLLGGGLLASQALMGNKAPPPAQRQVQAGANQLSQQGQTLAQPAQAALTETAGTLGRQGAANSSALETGQLPMGVAASNKAREAAAVAAIRSKFAQMGLNGSSMEAQAIAQARIAAAKQAFDQAMGLADLGFRQTTAGANINAGLSTTGTNMQTNALNYFNGIAQQELQDDADLSNAIARFAGALPGAVTLPGERRVAARGR